MGETCPFLEGETGKGKKNGPEWDPEELGNKSLRVKWAHSSIFEGLDQFSFGMVLWVLPKSHSGPAGMKGRPGQTLK